MKNIAIFASGEGTNAQNIINYFELRADINVALVISNNPSANVLRRAKNKAIEALVINRNEFYDNQKVVNQLKEKNIDFIVLSGFLWIVPESLIQAFPNKIINIHPSLLPKFGGKGMYGMHVHRAVVEAKEKKSGISIHYVNQHYDEGKLIAQHSCDIEAEDTPEMVAQKIHQLEFEFFPKTIEMIVNQ